MSNKFVLLGVVIGLPAAAFLATTASHAIVTAKSSKWIVTADVGLVCHTREQTDEVIRFLDQRNEAADARAWLSGCHHLPKGTAVFIDERPILGDSLCVRVIGDVTVIGRAAIN